MKRFFILVFVAFVAILVKSQTTYNVRAGAGFAQIVDFSYNSYGNYTERNRDDGFGCVISFQANMPFKSRSYSTFSPSLITVYRESHDFVFTAPLHIGYKMVVGNQKLFFPKIGPMVSFETYDNRFTVGPSVELAWEFKDFVLAVNGYVGILDWENFNGFLTMGYKF